MTEKMTDAERIRRALEAMTGQTPAQEEVDKVQVYHIEQQERAQELYESAVEDGVNFATTDESGDTFVNTKWLGMLVRTWASVIAFMPEEAQGAVMTNCEVLGQTILAADKFVGKK